MKRHDSGLEVRSLTKSFGSSCLIEDATFDVAPGEAVCLTGDNGAGKSTLLRCLVGLARFGGVARFNGEDIGRGGGYLSRVGYVPQSPSLVETATCEETVALFARLKGVKFDPGLLPPGFLPDMQQPVGYLSGGQRKRLALAVAFIGAPDLLLLDEPLADLDDAGRAMAARMIRVAAMAGSAVLIVSPAAIDLEGSIDRILLLTGKSVVGTRSVERFLATRGVPRRVDEMAGAEEVAS